MAVFHNQVSWELSNKWFIESDLLIQEYSFINIREAARCRTSF
jgi:hypothetical protein